MNTEKIRLDMDVACPVSNSLLPACIQFVSDQVGRSV